MTPKRTWEREVAYIGVCKRCKKAGRKHAHRIEATLITTVLEHQRVGFNGAELSPTRTYQYTLRYADGREVRESHPDSISVRCLGCAPLPYSEAYAQGSGATIYMKRIQGVKNETPCSAKCTGATGPSCECACGGKNHGCAHA